jgi:hypothetical protein
MPHRAITTLQQILRPHVGLNKSRLETLPDRRRHDQRPDGEPSHLACERPSTALVA